MEISYQFQQKNKRQKCRELLSDTLRFHTRMGMGMGMDTVNFRALVSVNVHFTFSCSCSCSFMNFAMLFSADFQDLVTDTNKDTDLDMDEKKKLAFVR
jgi:hypothetical protein